MTLTAVDTPLYPAGADRTSGEATEKKSAYYSGSDVFLKLLETTAVHQVAYTEGSKEFKETLDLHDETTTRENKPDDKRNKYDAIGLLDQQEQASQGSADLTAKSGDSKGAETPKGPVEALGQHSGLDVQKQATPGGNAGYDEAALLAALGLPSQPSTVTPPKSAPLVGGQKDGTGGNTGSTQNGQNAAVAAAGRSDGTAEAVERSRIASDVSRQAGNARGKANGGVDVTKVPADVVSQPASSLAASTVLTAQASRAERMPAETPVVLAEDLGAEGRPVLDGNSGRTNNRPQTNAVQPQVKPQAAGSGPEGQQPQINPQPAPVVANPQPVAPAAARGDVLVQSNQAMADPLAGGPAANNSGQATQRTQPQPPAQAPKPPVRPDQLTGQIAVQIKKAIGQGSDHIRIQLKPAELGRVEIRLEVNDKGHAVAVVSADRADTLDLLQRDASGLRQALQEAGLSTDSNSLSFNLRGEGGKFGQEMAERGHSPHGGGGEAGTDGEADTTDTARLAEQNAVSDGHVNVQV